MGLHCSEKYPEHLKSLNGEGKSASAKLSSKYPKKLVKLSENFSNCQGLRNQDPWEFRGIKVHEECSISLSVKSTKVANDW